MSEFLEKIRGSEESVKRRWVIGFSLLATAVVVVLWMLYFNALLLSFEPGGGTAIAQEDLRGGAFFWERAKGAGALAYGGVAYAWRAVGETLLAPRVYVIK